MKRFGPRHDVGLEDAGVLAADARVDAVAGDHQVGVGVVGVADRPRSRRRASTPSASQRACRMLSSFLRPMPTKPWPPERIVRPLNCSSMSSQCANDGLDRVGGVAVPFAHVVHRRVGEHHAPAEGVVGPVALDDGDVVRCAPQLLHQQREVQAGGAAADADDLHAASSRAQRSGSGVDVDDDAAADASGQDVLPGLQRVGQPDLVGDGRELGAGRGRARAAPGRCGAAAFGAITLSMPSSVTPRRMKGATEAGRSMPCARPQAATAPP